MKWKKLGKIFDPAHHRLDFDCTDFAQSPQALVFNDFVRIYFSTRKRQRDNLFVSNIVFVDFSKDFSEIVGYSKHEVIPLGNLGCFDEHGIFPINIVRHEQRILAYTCGWSRRVAVPVETATGFAESFDAGLTFKKNGDGPILCSSLKEPMLVGDSFVRIYDGMFHMWYIFGARWYIAGGTEPPARVYKIGYATSENGTDWRKIEEGNQIIADVLDENECQALPTVAKWRDRYHMYFCYRYATDFRTNPERGYRLGYAYSHDLKTWTRADDLSGITFSPDGWDSQMQCYPHLFIMDDKLYLLYNGNQFGRYGFGVAVLE